MNYLFLLELCMYSSSTNRKHLLLQEGLDNLVETSVMVFLSFLADFLRVFLYLYLLHVNLKAHLFFSCSKIVLLSRAHVYVEGI